MAGTIGLVSGGSWIHQRNCNGGMKNVNKKKKKVMKVRCGGGGYYSTDPYRTLRITPNADETEVKKAFRQLALQYHPDVCKGSNCGVQFHQINEAYDVVMSNLRGETEKVGLYGSSGNQNSVDDDESMRGMCEPDWDLWEEWMGWEGAGIRDYSSHINPYI